MSRWSQRTPNRRPCAVQTGPPPVQASPSPLWRGLARSITHVLRVLACFASKQPRSQAFNLPLPGNTNAGHATHTNCQIPYQIISFCSDSHQGMPKPHTSQTQRPESVVLDRADVCPTHPSQSCHAESIYADPSRLHIGFNASLKRSSEISVNSEDRKHKSTFLRRHKHKST